MFKKRVDPWIERVRVQAIVSMNRDKVAIDGKVRLPCYGDSALHES